MYHSPFLSARRITLVIHALHGGGAERIAARTADYWAAQGHEVTVITLDRVESDRYTVCPKVRRVGLGLMAVSHGSFQAIRNNVRRVRALRRAIRQSDPECVVGLTDRTNILVLLACRKMSLPVVIAEHSDPRRQKLTPAWEWLRRRTYPRCAAAVALTESIAEYLRGELKVRRVYAIANGIDRPPAACPRSLDRREPVAVAMGRLSREKGFDLLISAFARIARKHDRWRLRILGEGPERSDLAARIVREGLPDRIVLAGWADRPDEELSHASLFVLSSRYEGIPMSLLEAMAAGLPVVSFDCESGPREVIRHGIDGLLVPPEDVEALAEAMDRLMSDPQLRQSFGRRALEVTDRFSGQRFFQRWDEVLRDVCPAALPP